MQRKFCQNQPRHRKLRVELLEDLRLLAVLTVQNDLDDTLANLSGDGELSLREAIEIANNPGAVIDGFVSNDVEDTIEFANALSGETVTLHGVDMDILSSLTIDASALAERVTIDANQQSRIFDIGADEGEFFLKGFSLTGGLVTGSDPFAIPKTGGGAIRFLNDGALTIVDSDIHGNLADGLSGGGILAGRGMLRLERSTVTGNTSLQGLGGGIYSGEVVPHPDPQNGELFLFLGELEILHSTISDNIVGPGRTGMGGGILARGSLTLTQSTVSGNLSEAPFGAGGISVEAGPVLIDKSTITNNSAAINPVETLPVGGIWVRGPNANIVINGSIIAGNRSASSSKEFQARNLPKLSYSLIGDTTGTNIDANTGVGNILNVDPLLGPLADNGGPTQTHALLPGSPALEAGDPSLVYDPNEFDQRGVPFSRVATGVLSGIPQQRIDIGAYEAQSPPSADFVDDDHVNGQDFLAWQRGFGTAKNATRAEGNSDDDGDVDRSDLAAWTASYGQAESPPPPVQTLASVRDQPTASFVDVSATWEQLSYKSDERSGFVDEEQSFVAVPSDRLMFNSDSPQTEQPVSQQVNSGVAREEAIADLTWLDDELLFELL